MPTGTRSGALGRWLATAAAASQAHEHQFVDSAISRYAASLVYYRLRQVDRDGTFTYSLVRTVAVGKPAGLT